MRTMGRAQSENKRDAILRSLALIDEKAVVSEDKKLHLSWDISLDFAEEVLREHLSIGENFPERTKAAIIRSAEMRWLKYKKAGNPQQKLSLFMRALNTEIRARQKRMSVLKVLMFLNVDRPSASDFSEVQVLGDRLRFVNWQDIQKLDLDPVWEKLELQDKRNPLLLRFPHVGKPIPDIGTFTPIGLRVNTYGPEAAVEIGSDRLDLLRAVFNTPSTLGSYTVFRSNPKPLSGILPSPVYAVFDEANKMEDLYVTVEKFDYKKTKIPEDQLSSLRFLLSKISPPIKPGSTWAYLTNIMRLYQKALDMPTTESAYLAMWQVLENCVGLGEQMTGNERIKSRVLVLLEPDALSQDLIDIIVNRRNTLVHLGTFPEDGDRLLFGLKLITDFVISRLIHLAGEYPMLAELKDYVSFASLGDEDLDRKRSIMKRISEERKGELTLPTDG